MIIPRWFLRRRTERYVQLANNNDLRAVGPLAEALRSWDSEVQKIAERALIRLLPRLRATDSALLTGEQRKCLYRALRGKNAELSIAILKALEQIGDADALPYIERLAAFERKGTQEARLREAAILCLPHVEERVKMQSAVETLLRASTETFHPEEYLRASTVPCVPADALRQSEEAVQK